jgi:hypothetical protein
MANNSNAEMCHAHPGSFLPTAVQLYSINRKKEKKFLATTLLKIVRSRRGSSLLSGEQVLFVCCPPSGLPTACLALPIVWCCPQTLGGTILLFLHLPNCLQSTPSLFALRARACSLARRYSFVRSKTYKTILPNSQNTTKNPSHQ